MTFSLRSVVFIGASLTLMIIGPATSADTGIWVDSFTGNDLLSQCTDTADSENQIKCTTYIRGVAAASNFFNALVTEASGNKECILVIPTGVTSEQLRDVVVKGITDEPQRRNEFATVLITTYLSKAYPCP